MTRLSLFLSLVIASYGVGCRSKPESAPGTATDKRTAAGAPDAAPVRPSKEPAREPLTRAACERRAREGRASGEPPAGNDSSGSADESAPVRVLLSASRWVWSFDYGTEPRVVKEELHGSAGAPVVVEAKALDVPHVFAIPELAVEFCVMPGTPQQLRLELPSQAGRYDIVNPDPSEDQNRGMRAELVVHAPGEFEAWLERERNQILAAANADPVAFGAELFRSKGCANCHTVDGSALTGPSLLGVWARTVAGSTRLAGGGTLRERFRRGDFDGPEDYLREQILEPGSAIVRGYERLMPAFRDGVEKHEIEALIAYLKSLN